MGGAWCTLFRAHHVERRACDKLYTCARPEALGFQAFSGVLHTPTMLASKTFVKKTKKGAVVKVVREHYLRDDVWCGVIGCTLCKQQERAPVIERCPIVVSHLCQYPHVLLPDTNVALHQTDFLEDAAITNVIVLQTVLQEVSKVSLLLAVIWDKNIYLAPCLCFSNLC